MKQPLDTITHISPVIQRELVNDRSAHIGQDAVGSAPGGRVIGREVREAVMRGLFDVASAPNCREVVGPDAPTSGR